MGASDGGVMDYFHLRLISERTRDKITGLREFDALQPGLLALIECITPQTGTSMFPLWRYIQTELDMGRKCSTLFV